MRAGLWVRVVEEEESGERLHPSHGVALHSVWVTRGHCHCMGCGQRWITDLLQLCSGTDSSLRTSSVSFFHPLSSMLIFQAILSTYTETFYADCHDNNKLTIPQCKALQLHRSLLTHVVLKTNINVTLSCSICYILLKVHCWLRVCEGLSQFEYF